MEKQHREAAAGTKRVAAGEQQLLGGSLNGIFINVYKHIKRFGSRRLAGSFSKVQRCACQPVSAFHPCYFTVSSFKALTTHYKRRRTSFLWLINSPRFNGNTSVYKRRSGHKILTGHWQIPFAILIPGMIFIRKVEVSAKNRRFQALLIFMSLVIGAVQNVNLFP